MATFKRLAALLALLGGEIATATAQKTNRSNVRRAITVPWKKEGTTNDQEPAPLVVFCDIADDELAFINVDTDDLIQVPYCDIDGWLYCSSSGYTQHTAIDPLDPKIIYVSTVSNGDQVPASVVSVTYDKIDWDGGTVSGLRVLGTAVYADPDEPSDFDYSIAQIEPSQPIQSWASPARSQVHGPTFRPGKPNIVYWGTWTNDDVIAISTKPNGEIKNIAAESYGVLSEYVHGFFFNPSGDKAIGATYWFDNPFVSLFDFGRGGSVFPTAASEVFLDNGDGTYGSFTHYASWLDDRYAYVATMQLGSTSLSGEYPVSGPGVYLVDAESGTATRVASTSQNKNSEGVWNSGSDAVIANGKLYVSEEETLDGNFPQEGVGSVGVFDINDDRSLSWIKRIVFNSGDGMPQGFKVGHGSQVVTGGDGKEYVFVASYASNHIIKIDTETDAVVKFWDESDGLNVPHGGFASGSYR